MQMLRSYTNSLKCKYHCPSMFWMGALQFTIQVYVVFCILCPVHEHLQVRPYARPQKREEICLRDVPVLLFLRDQFIALHDGVVLLLQPSLLQKRQHNTKHDISVLFCKSLKISNLSDGVVASLGWHIYPCRDKTFTSLRFIANSMQSDMPAGTAGDTELA